jgi:hypothetical protein
MKKILLNLCITFGVISTAHAQFGLPSLGGGGSKSGGENLGQIVDEFYNKNKIISTGVANSLEQIVGALGDKTDIATEKAKYESYSKTTDPQEKGKQEGTIIKEAGAVAQKLLDSADAKDKMAKLSPEMQKKVVSAILNIANAGLQIPSMLQTGKKGIDSLMANPSAALSLSQEKVNSVKNGVSLFTDALPKIVKVGKTGLDLLKDVKVEAGNPSADTPVKNDNAPLFGD